MWYKNITMIPYHFVRAILMLTLICVANDVANGVAKCALPGKVMQ